MPPELPADPAADPGLEACAAVVARGDPDRFLATMAAPPAARARLMPLFAFNVEVARAPWVSAEPMIGEMRLQWWRDVLAEIAAGGPVRRHEVSTPLAAVLGPAEAALLDGLIEARRADLERAPFADEAALAAYLEATAGHLAWAGAQVLGAETGEAAVRDAGFAQGLANYLLAIPALEARGRQPLPDGRPEAVAALAREGLARLARARQAGVPRAAVPVLRTGWRAGALLARAVRAPALVGAGRLAEPEALRRGRLVLKSFTGGW